MLLIYLDCFEVHKQVIASAARRDEPVAFLVVPPFDDALLSVTHCWR